MTTGIMQKSTSSPYQTSVNVQFSRSTSGLKMVETCSWQETEFTTDVTRSVPLIGPCIDVDEVDASYSINQTLMDLPSTISGTDSIAKFGIEHVLLIQDNVRVYAFCFYGTVWMIVFHKSFLPTKDNKNHKNHYWYKMKIKKCQIRYL